MTKNSCDWQPDEQGDFTAQGSDELPAENRSALHRFGPDYRWEGVATEAYRPEGSGFASVLRNVIIGGNGETCRFHLRYFELGRGGYSALEKHEHEHVVICVRGMGKAVVGDRAWELRHLDVLYVAPNEPHQLLNEGDGPFGFFCMVNADRDRAVDLLEDELKWLQESASTRELIRL
jgi:ribulose-bisphosphate carboxylase large chain